MQVRYRGRKFAYNRTKIDSPIEYDYVNKRQRKSRFNLTELPETTMEQDAFDPEEIEKVLREQEWDNLKEQAKDNMVRSSLCMPCFMPII